MISFASLKAQFLADTGAGASGATPALARALEHIGWRSVREPTPEEFAGDLVLLIDACVHEHRNVADLAFGIATTLRHAGPLLDGGLPPVEAYLPAAEELLRLYVHQAAAGRPAW